MKPTFKLSTKKINEAMQAPAVRKALRSRAERAASRSRAVAYSAGASAFARSIRVEDGTRPGVKSPTGLKRSYARVVGDSSDAVHNQDRGASLTRRKILRRGFSGG